MSFFRLLLGGDAMRMKCVLGCVLCLLTLAVTTACSYQTVATTSDGIRAVINVGDTVRVTTPSGQQSTFRVTEIDNESIAGEDERHMLTQVASLERREVNRSAAWVVVGVAAIAAASGSGGSY